MLRELISRRVFAAIARSLGVEDAELRATLVGALVVGLIVVRHIVGVEPLASLDADRLVAAIAPILQRYLVGELSGGENDATRRPASSTAPAMRPRASS
jgi:hypothetical protein